MNIRFYSTIALLLLALIEPAHAAETGLPWEAPLKQIMDSLTGPVAQLVAFGAVCAAGGSLIIGQTSGITQRLLVMVIGLGLIFNAAIILDLFGQAEGAMFL